MRRLHPAADAHWIAALCALALVGALTAAVPVVAILAVTLTPDPAPRPYRAAEKPLDLRGFGPALRAIYEVAFAIGILAAVVAASSLAVRFSPCPQCRAPAAALGCPGARP
jgi:hypothetical protein